MGSSFRFTILLLGMVALVVVLAFLGVRADRWLATLETLQRAPTAPPLQELRGGLQQVAFGRTVYVPVYSHIYAGANFLVDWGAETAVTEPLIEAVMVTVGGNQSFAFRSPGYPISRLGAEEPQN